MKNPFFLEKAFILEPPYWYEDYIMPPQDGKVKFYIEGLDKALNGGIPKGNLVLLSGGAGTGKSTLALQYLINGAKHGEKGLLISTEQNIDELHRQAASFGWDLDEFIKKGLIQIKYLDIVKGEDALGKIFDAYSSFSPTRMVIDSLTSLTDSMFISGMSTETAFSMVQVAESVSPIPRTEKIVSKSILYHLIGKLKLFTCTTIMTSELPEKGAFLSADRVSEFICDGVIVLYYLGMGSTEFRSMQVRKMRYTQHEKDYLIYDLTAKGFETKEATLKI